jgi:hypothetical protein
LRNSPEFVNVGQRISKFRRKFVETYLPLVRLKRLAVSRGLPRLVNADFPGPVAYSLWVPRFHFIIRAFSYERNGSKTTVKLSPA